MPWSLVALTPPASALTLALVDEDAPYPGVTLQTYRTSSPDTDTFVVRVDLCEPGVHVDATRAPDVLRTTGAWGAEVGAQVVVNADFYRTDPSPLHVYGRAIGEGVAWPLDQTGADPAYSGEWYWQNYGWIGFGHDRVEFTHTEWVKDNATTLGVVDGWALADLGPEPPYGTLALVSGFPELVIEGNPVACASPTDSTCFPDRSDMRARHPRTAMGLDAGRTELILAVVDGRTDQSAGMYGAELADLMGQLGAWQAFNLDGGGSSELWVEDRGYVNNTSGNNLGSGTRAVANHLGVFSDGSGSRPWHCATEPPCATLGPAGGVLDDDSACFRTYGDPTYWREEAAGQGGHLYWTNAWDTDQPENWAWWQLELEDAGTYDVQVYVDPAWGVFGDARYEVVADGVRTEVFVDQGAAAGWVSLGAFGFAAGGDQHVAVFDDAAGAVPADAHVVADAVQLVRLDPDPPADTADTAAGADTGATGTGGTGTDPTGTGSGSATTSTGTAGDGPTLVVDVADDGGCGCTTPTGPASGAAAVGVLVLVRRRGRGRRQCNDT